MDNYLKETTAQFRQYKKYGDSVLERVPESHLFEREKEDSNSIALIVQHLAGNMHSRWTDFLTSDGEKEWRNRDTEFEQVLNTKAEVLTIWEAGWSVFLNCLDNLTDADLTKIVYIRNEPHTVFKAIQRQLAHYPYHIGQMVLLGKIFSDNWESLSIPKRKSAQFNQEMQHKQHIKK